MIKKLCILLLLSVCTVAPGMAQQYSSSDASFAPKKGQWQVSAVIGNSQMFNQDMEYLLPTYWNGNSNPEYAFNNPVGLPGTDFQSSDPGYWLNLGNLNSNSLMNLIGIQGKYFLTDRWDVNAMFSMNISATPSRDYIEGDHTVTEMPIQDYKYIEGKIQNAWTIQLGSNYYFNTKNERINLYAGGVLGWQMGRIATTTPYTGETIYNEDALYIYLPNEPDYDSPYNVYGPNHDPDLTTESVQLYTPNSRAGQIFGLRVGAVTGIEYSIGFFATPNLKIGFRF